MADEVKNSSEEWLTRMDQNRRPTAYGLLAVGALAAVAALVLILRDKSDWLPEILGLSFFGLAAVVSGTLFLMNQPTPAQSSAQPNRDQARLVVLAVGSALGLMLTLTVLWRSWFWREYFSGGLEAWRGPQGWRIWLLILGGLAGLGIMFATLLLVRSEEQEQSLLRRLLYGFNAVLTGILVLMILLFVNVLAFVYVPAQADWTGSEIYTLNPRSISILNGLEKPVTLYVILETRGTVFGELENLLDNCLAATDKITVRYLFRDQDLEALDRLIKKYVLVDDLGILIVYGSDSSEDHQFIRMQELVESGMGQTPKFKGEDALMTALDLLEQGKKKPIIYLTQANGELSIDALSKETERYRATVLRDRLEKDNYEVKGLRLTPVTGEKTKDGPIVSSTKVPDDASVVVILGPRTPYSQQALAALREYMSPTDPSKPKGKVIALLDVVTSGQPPAMVKTGLETLFAGFDIEIGDDRVLTLDERAPERVIVTANPQLKDSNPVAAALQGVFYLISRVRTVQPKSDRSGLGAAMGLKAEPLLIALGNRQPIWQESDFSVNARELIRDLLKNPNKPENRQKIDQFTNILPVGVAVSEVPQMDPMNPHARVDQKSGAKPRLVVIGNASLASDSILSSAEGGGSQLYDLLASSLAWLRDRPQSIGLAPKERDRYSLDANTNISRLVFLPLSLMLVGIVGLGLGVWVVRRR